MATSISISREMLTEMFDGMRSQAPWDVDGPLLWGYFFQGPNEASLKPLQERLVADGYQYVVLRQIEDDNGPTGGYQLHVERVEHHTVDSLHRRNAELVELADAHTVGYDGMDVGPAG